MASIRSTMMLHRFARQSPTAMRLLPRTTPLQRRNFASHQDATHAQVPSYEKAENGRGKRFSQFDLGGKVFVVTGAARRPPHSLRADASS
ncbi:uncharacterized protein K460DRAFT_366134 [Cucurbitaria berberidis CBS 394.84]|uniref:Uncharacterized protein n=1 Tax=Cucurbitaria berberidis CBS 394.84 TaxID=1168544 RepID=A0A9P4L7R4_9PLEO|nr:uncharacterized protein K460DRAFT_366134 [Cucurbitaria berberidis CBS 394.84]KAF1845255.1 hypothetical protein K460DRAFT_366134 [Cucurbitaria berberidis CBS 394.84]